MVNMWNRLTYFLVNHAPGDFAYKSLELVSPLFEPILVAADALNRSNALVNGGVLAVRKADFHDSVVAQFICGTLAASGGGLIGGIFFC